MMGGARRGKNDKQVRGRAKEFDAPRTFKINQRRLLNPGGGTVVPDMCRRRFGLPII